MKESALRSKSYAFAVLCITLYKDLTQNKREFVISKQLLPSGNAVGANIRKARNAVSAKDFIHKLSISQKECNESVYWLELLKITQELIKEYSHAFSSVKLLLCFPAF